jgi:hypothetical protein
MQGLWFLWVAGPWGAVLLGRWLFGQHPGGGSGPGRVQGGPLPGLQSPGGQQDLTEAGSGERGESPGDHMARRQERMQEHLQRRQEHMQEHQQRRQDRLQRRQDQP